MARINDDEWRQQAIHGYINGSGGFTFGDAIVAALGLGTDTDTDSESD